MKLFHEMENRYYELMTYLLNRKKSYSKKEISKILEKEFQQANDFEVTDVLFSEDIDKSVVFEYKDKRYTPIIPKKVPIRNTKLENEALKMLAKDTYSRHFLSEKTIQKIKNVTKQIKEEWNIEDIEIKSQSQFGVTQATKTYKKELTIIADAICEYKMIQFSNRKAQIYECRNTKVLPIRIEYSYFNDLFQICAYEPEKEQFIKVDLETIQNMKKLNETYQNMEEEYKIFIQKNSQKVILEIEPISYIIERCFRLFSFYDRKAIFDKEENKYQLEINYLKFDEKELIRDILSLGSSVFVVEPKKIQQEVYQCILKARNLYME